MFRELDVDDILEVAKRDQKVNERHHIDGQLAPR